MSDRTPQQKGRGWEPEFAKSIGAAVVKNSGAGFKKGDVIGPEIQGSKIIWSLKWRGDNKSVRVEDAWMDEMLAAINAPGGYGGDMIPAIATKTQGYELVIMRKQDAIALMHDAAAQSLDPSGRATGRYALPHHHRRLPELLRGTQED